MNRMRERMRGDEGMTLIEVVVSMTIMAIFISMFTVGMLQMSRSAGRSEAILSAQAQVNLAFLRLDKEIRYASGISAPSTANSDYYVEYLTANTGTARCTQLRLNTGQKVLQRREWVRGENPLKPTPWVTLASQVDSTKPFTFIPPDDTFNFQRLQVNLTAVVGVNDKSASKTTDVTFTALNTVRSSDNTNTADVCSEGKYLP